MGKDIAVRGDEDAVLGPSSSPHGSPAQVGVQGLFRMGLSRFMGPHPTTRGCCTALFRMGHCFAWVLGVEGLKA